MALLLLLISQGRTPGGHGLLEAVPRLYQVTPDISGRRRATKQEQVRPQIWPTASKRVSSPPVGTIPSASDITDDPNHNSKPQGDSDGARPPSDRQLTRALIVPMHGTQRVRPSGASVGRRRASTSSAPPPGRPHS